MGQSDRDIDLARREGLGALLGVLGGAVGLAALTGCEAQAAGAPEATASTLQAFSGTASVQYVSWIGTTQQVGTDQNLRNLNGTNTFLAVAAGFWTPGDGGGGVFYWDAASSTGDDGGTIIVPANQSPAPGRWVRIYSGALNVKWFGAKGTGQTADDPYISAAAASAGSAGAIYLPPGTYSIQSTMTVGASVVFEEGSVVQPGANATVTLRAFKANGNQQIFDVSQNTNGISLANLANGPDLTRIVYAAWFGAKGDFAGAGIGTDNTIPINAAITTAVQSVRAINSSLWGGHVKIGFGSFRITDAISIRQSANAMGVVLEGETAEGSGGGFGTQIIWDGASSTTPAIRLWSRDCILRHLTIGVAPGRTLYAGVDETQDPLNTNICTTNLFDHVHVTTAAIAGGTLTYGFVHGDYAGAPEFPLQCDNTRWMHCFVYGSQSACIYCPNTRGQAKKCQILHCGLVMAVTAQGALQGSCINWKSGGFLAYACDFQEAAVAVSVGILDQCVLQDCLSENCGRLLFAGGMWAGPTNAQIIGGRYAWGSQLNQDGQVIQFYGAGTLTIIGMFNDYIYNPSWKIAAYNDAVNMRACRLVCIGCVFPNTSPIADPGTLVAGAAGTESVMIQCTGINSANSLMLPIPDAHVMHGGMNVATGLAPVWGYDGSGSYQNGGIKRWIFDADYQTTRSLSDELAAVVSTADGVQHPGVSYVAPSSVSYLAVEVEVVARSAAGACAWWLLRRGFVTSSTSVAPIASTTVVDSHGSNGGAVPAGWSADVTTDGKSNVFAAVQNANGDAVNWTTRLRAVTRT